MERSQVLSVSGWFVGTANNFTMPSLPTCNDQVWGGPEGLEHMNELDTANKLGHLVDINISQAAHDATNFTELMRKAGLIMKYLADSRHEIISNPRVPMVSAMVDRHLTHGPHRFALEDLRQVKPPNLGNNHIKKNSVLNILISHFFVFFTFYL